jgi:hypothetical protein
MAARKTPSRGSKPDKIMRDALQLELAHEIKAQDPDSDPKKGPKLIKIRRSRLVAIALVNKAIKGDVAAIREINERMDGRVPQVVKGDTASGAIPIDITNLTTAQIEKLKERITADLIAKGRLRSSAA